MDYAVLIGGDEQAVTEFDTAMGFAFLNPFGVLLENGVKLLA